MRFPARWLKEHPLSVEDLQQEIEFLRRRLGMAARLLRQPRRGRVGSSSAPANRPAWSPASRCCALVLPSLCNSQALRVVGR
jgi:hypothetical protein